MELLGWYKSHELVSLLHPHHPAQALRPHTRQLFLSHRKMVSCNKYFLGTCTVPSMQPKVHRLPRGQSQKDTRDCAHCTERQSETREEEELTKSHLAPALGLSPLASIHKWLLEGGVDLR